MATTRKRVPQPGEQSSMFDAFEEGRLSALPDTMEAAIPVYRGLIERYHAAVIAGDFTLAEKIEDEADDLAAHLNGDTRMGMGVQGGVCDQLAEATAAEKNAVPQWGQRGEFIIEAAGCRVRIEQHGMLDLGGMGLPGFDANIVDLDKPFISETGYRSFIGGVFAVMMPAGATPDVAARFEIERDLMTDALSGKCRKTPKQLVMMKEEYRKFREPGAPAEEEQTDGEQDTDR